MEKELFMLLRLGLGNSTPEKEDISLLQGFTQAQWEALEETAQAQGVAGIVLDGLEALKAYDGTAKAGVALPEKKFMIQWIGQVLQNYEARNMQQLLVIDSVQKEWAKEGIRTMIMKGQAMGTYYPEPKHRSPGDIDCYLFYDNDNVNPNPNDNGSWGDAYRKGNEVAKTFADSVDERWYKHSQIFFGGQMLENHQYFVHTREGKSSKELNQVLVGQLKGDSSEFGLLSTTSALLPPPMFNALFLTYHAMTHFLEEGLKLKQILDWAMFLKREADKVDWTEFYRQCDKFHIRRFADVMTDIAVRYLGVNVSVNVNVDKELTERVLHSTFYDEDYVFSSGKSGWANRLHIVRNLWKYRWKYHKVYQHSILRQLWFYATGYLFKTE